MATVNPWYSGETNIYHVRDDCGRWVQTTEFERRPGPGTNRRICIDCLVLLVREIGRH